MRLMTFMVRTGKLDIKKHLSNCYLQGYQLQQILTILIKGNCKKEKYPLLRALNVALTEKSSGTREEDDGGSCDAADYSTTARSVVTSPIFSSASASMPALMRSRNNRATFAEDAY